MAITASMVKELRETTGAGMMDAKKALTETNGDFEAAIDWLRTKGLAKAAKKSSRVAAEGLVAVAISDGKGVAVEVNSETDFVAKTDGFSELAHSVAMQIAATNPLSLDISSLDESVIAREKDIFKEQAKSEGKPDEIIEKMINGRLQKFYQESCLLEQTYIKDPDKKVKDLITESVATLGENISINRFIRFSIGE